MKQLITPSIFILSVALAPGESPSAASDFGRSADLQPESHASYFTAMKKRIAINSREVDPFGLPQILTTKTWKPPQRADAPKPVALQQIVDAIQITAIQAGRGEFLVGSRVFREGETIPIERGTFQATLRVQQVTSESVSFQNLETGETATRALQIGPRDIVEPEKLVLPEGVDLEDRAPLRLPDSDRF